MTPRRRRAPFYELPSPENGEALKQARRVTGLDEEIALLRARLKRYVQRPEPDDGLILNTITVLARALMAQARIKGIDPAETSARVAAAIRELGSILEEDHP